MVDNTIQIFARIRPQLCWEKASKCLTVNHDAIGIAPAYNSSILKPIVNFYQFKHVFEEDASNVDVFDSSVKRLCNHSATAIKGNESVFIACGQTASGKTETILGTGTGNANNKGVLQLSVQHLLKHCNVKKLSISAVETYGTIQTKILFYDLLNSKNNRNHWTKKVTVKLDRESNHDKAFIQKNLETIGDIQSIIETVKHCAHFAATSRQPQSSRGHVLYILRITRKDSTVAKLLFLDLGGSDNKSAFTKQFTKQSHPHQYKLRMQESKVISYGLMRLTKFISKYRKGGALNRFNEGNLRTLLYPYFQCGVDDPELKPQVVALFTLSPSVTSSKESRKTLSRVKLMSNIPIVPERCSWRKSQLNSKDKEERFELILGDLNDHIQRLSIEEGQLDEANGQAVVDRVRKSIILKQSEMADIEVAISQKGWTNDDAQKQQELIENDANEMTEKSMKKEHTTLKNYWKELKLAMIVAKQFAKNNDNDNQAESQGMSTNQTVETIQLELDQISGAVMLWEQRISTVFDIPLDILSQENNVKDVNATWEELDASDNEDKDVSADIAIEQREEEYGDLSDHEIREILDATDMFDELTTNNPENSEGDWFVGGDDSVEDITVSDLHGKQSELQIYKDTLRQSLVIINKSAAKSPQQLDDSTDPQVHFIEEELQKVQQELMAIKEQVSAMNAHNTTIAQALQNDTANTVPIKEDADGSDNDDHDDDHHEEEFDNFYKRPFPRYIEIRDRRRTTNLIIRSMRCHSDLFIVGYQDDMSIACDIITKLEKEKIVKVVRIETGLAFANYDRPSICIKFIVCCGELGHCIHGFQQRRMIDVFERYDKDMTGFVSLENIKEMDLAKKLKATTEQSRKASEYCASVNQDGNVDLPHFIRYASILVHPLLSDKVFRRSCC